MNDKESRTIRIVLYILMALFVLLFVVGLLQLGGIALLVNTILYLFLAIVFLLLVRKASPEGKLKIFLLVTGFSSIIFSLGLTYGIFGIWSYYEINDIIYLGTTLPSWIGFMIGSVGSLILMRK